MIVIDTNVVFTGLISTKGASYCLLTELANGNLDYALSTYLLFEYEDVLTRNFNKIPYNSDELESILDSVATLAHRVSPMFLWRPYLKDPKDDMILELAVASNASAILTYNLRDFKGSEDFGIEAIEPLLYLKRKGTL